MSRSKVHLVAALELLIISDDLPRYIELIICDYFVV